MLPILERELAIKRDWITTEELLDYYAIGQATPGIIAVNVATFIGYKQLGIIGGIAATLAIISPSIIVISLIAAFLNNFDQIRVVQKIMKGINIGVAAMLTYTVVNFCKKTVHGAFGIMLFTIAFIMLYILNVNTIWVIITGAISGLVYTVLNSSYKELGK